MSQDELADAVEIQTPAVSHTPKNRHGNPTLSTSVALAQTLRVRFSDPFRAR